MPDLMHHITDIARCAALYRQEELAALNLKSCHASYLDTICSCPGITQDQLARRIFINKSNVARQVVILEEDGFIIRKPSEADKRVMELYPTEKTLELMPQISQVLKSWETRIADSLTEEERQSLSDLLAKMKDRATEYMEDH